MTDKEIAKEITIAAIAKLTFLTRSVNTENLLSDDQAFEKNIVMVTTLYRRIFEEVSKD